ncbi:unnamed protein product [Mucor fragilis]
MLLGYHASPDITDSHGWSAIQYAERNPEIVQLCEEVLRMKRSELVTSNTCTVNYPIHYAKLSHLLCTIPNYPSSLSHLQFDTLKEIDHLDPSAAPLVHIIQSAFLQAIKIHDHLSLQTLLMKSPPLNGTHRCGPLLINHHDPKTGLTAFHHAMRTKPLPSLDTITMLFQAGADMNSQTYYGRTALHHLARFGIDKDGQSWGIQKSSTGKATETQQQQQQQQQQHPPTAPSTGVNIPQHLAMCASLLIRFGSLVNIADPTGNTPLHFAAEFGGVPEVLEVLILEGGADLSLKNKKSLTPLDVCKSEDIKRRMLQLESERKHANKTKSVISSLSGTIRPFDSASEYNRSSITRSVSRSTAVASAIKAKSMIAKASASFLSCSEDSTHKLPMSQQKLLLVAAVQRTKDDASCQEYSDFHVILKAFFGYQTTFTDSIESSLAYITDSILGSWNMAQNEHVSAIQQLEKTITQLRFDLREAHEMFDATDQLVEKVMMSFRKELEQVEQVHQADWEMSELQHDKIEKLFDVFERIDGRFCQLELAQDDLIGQIECLRKAAARRQQQLKMQTGNEEQANISDCVVHLSQSLLILQTVPIDQVLYLRDDRSRLYQDMTVVVDQVVQEIETHMDQSKPDDKHKLAQAKAMVQERWLHVKEVLTKTHPATADSQQQPHQLKRSVSQPTTVRQKHTVMANIYNSPRKGGDGRGHPSLNQLELSFDILHSNLYEIQKDIEEVTEHLEKLTMSKKKMYELCLSLEKERNDPAKTRTEDEIQAELSQVMLFTQQLFDKQHALDKERTQLLKEYTEIEQQLEATRDSLHKVRPPALLQGLLDRLDTDETPCVRVEKDWKEDSNLVTEIVADPQAEDDESCASSTTSTSQQQQQQQETQLTVLQSKQLGVQCASKLSTLCYIARLDASLYCLKVLASHTISKSRQNLLQVQASLGQASTDLDETRNQMTQLYDDAAEVARQVFALKTELETIVRHRKEEVVKVWEVVDEVSEGVDAKAIQCQQQSQKQPKAQQKVPLQVVADQGEQHHHHHQQQERIEEQDRHQWIIRELEQLQHVHESLQDAIDELKQEQVMISQSLRKLASVFIEPQVDRLVGQDEESLLSVSDRLAELMDRMRDNDIGLRPTSMSFAMEQQQQQQQQQQVEKKQEAAASAAALVPVKSITTGVGPRIHHVNKTTATTANNRLSRLSAATNRLSASTYNSNRSSYYVRSPSSVLVDNANSSKRLSAAMSIRTDKKRMSIISATSLSSLSSYQQERMMARASNLSSALSKVQQQKNTNSNKQITCRK